MHIERLSILRGLKLLPHGFYSASSRQIILDGVRGMSHPPQRMAFRQSTRGTPPDFQVKASRQCESNEIDEPEQLRLRLLSDALLVASNACQSQSLLATKSLVESIIEAFRQGFIVKDFEVSLALRGFEIENDILSEGSRQVLVSWVTLVMLTLWQVGVSPRSKAFEAFAEDFSRGQESLGMLGFVKQLVGQAENGLNLKKLQVLQTEDVNLSQSAKLMQQNTLLIILTIEIVRAQGFASTFAIQEVNSMDRSSFLSEAGGGNDLEDACVYRPTGYLHSFLTYSDKKGTSILGDEESLFEADWGLIEKPRALAVRLALNFYGGTMGSSTCTNCFVDCGWEAYKSGFAANTVLNQLDSHEFREHGGLLPILEQPKEKRNISRQLFAWWLSIVYMSLAQLGAPREACSTVSGWAWAESIDEESGPLEPSSISNLVSNTLQRLELEKGNQDADSLTLAGRLKDNTEVIEKLPTYRQEALVKQAAEDISMVSVEDIDLRNTSSTALVVEQMITLVELTWRKSNNVSPG